jgi:hypothetical protein
MKLLQRLEATSIQEGVNCNESNRAYWVDIRVGENCLSIYIPKDNPKDYKITEHTKEKWVEKLWL